MNRKIGEEFQKETSYRAGADRIIALHGEENEAGETGGGEGGTMVRLPEPETSGGNGLWDAISSRRSIRQYEDSPLTPEEISQLLWAMQGITGGEYGYRFRAAPSAGALYPVETYAVVHDVETIEPGVYRYSPGDHTLVPVRTGDHRQRARKAALGQSMAADAPVLFVWTAVFARSTGKYKQRAYRYVYLDAGHIGGHLSVAAAAMGLGSCQIGALFDDLSNDLVGVDGEGEGVLYMSCVGRSVGRRALHQ